jgi:hypothetical protein
MREVAEIARARDDGCARCGSTRYYDKGWYKVCAGVGRVCKLVTKTGGWCRENRETEERVRVVGGFEKSRDKSGVLGKLELRARDGTSCSR